MSKLVPSSHALAGRLFLALETALLGCLASPVEADRPNSQVGRGACARRRGCS